jgi:signal transduction protein with GAF and PtsI domain
MVFDSISKGLYRSQTALAGYDKEDAMVGKEKDYLTALYQVAKVINGSLQPADVLEQIVKSAAEVMGVKACSLRLLDSAGEKLLWGAAYGLSEGYIRKGTVVVQESGLDTKALQGRPIYLRDAQTDPDFQYGEKAKAEGLKSVLVVPLTIENRPVGVLRVYSGVERLFDEAEVAFMELVANLSAIALENARLHEALRANFDRLFEDRYRLDDN